MINATTLRQLLFFGVVGITATITHYIVALLCHEWLGVTLYIANLVGYLSAVSVSYFGHGKLTFRVELNNAVLRRFVIVSITAFLVSEGLLYVMEDVLLWPHRISLAVVVAIIPVTTFILSKLWVYRPV